MLMLSKKVLLEKIDNTICSDEDYDIKIKIITELAKRIVRVCEDTSSKCYSEYACWECPNRLPSIEKTMTRLKERLYVGLWSIVRVK